MLHGSGIEQVSSINDHGHVHVVVQSDPIQFPVFRPFCEQQQGVRMMSGTVRALSSSLVIGHWSLALNGLTAKTTERRVLIQAAISPRHGFPARSCSATMVSINVSRSSACSSSFARISSMTRRLVGS